MPTTEAVIPTAQLVDWVRAKGFEYKREGDRARLYRKPGTVDIVEIRKSATVSKVYARHVLRAAGYTGDEIERMLPSRPPT